MQYRSDLQNVEDAIDGFEAVAPLEGEVEVERVIDAESERIYRVRGTLFSRASLDAFLTDNGIAIKPLEWTNPVPVTVQDGSRSLPIGFADVHWEGDFLMADITMMYARPERLIIEGGERIWASPEMLHGGEEQLLQLRSLFLTRNKSNDPDETPLVPVSQ